MVSPQVFWPYFTLVVFTIAGLAACGREFGAAHGLDKAGPLGRITLAIPMAVFGAEHLSSAEAIMNGVPKWMPGKLFWTYFVGVALIAAAASIITRVRMGLSATLLGIMLFCFVAMIHVPNAIAAPANRFGWTIVARDSSFGAGAILLAILYRADGARSRIATAAVSLIAAVAVFFGVENVLHPECVPAVPLAKIVPAWIPLAHFWSPLTGALMVAGGVAMFAKNASQRAAAGLGVWVLALVMTLYLAIMIAKPDIEGVNYFADTMLYAAVLLLASRPVLASQRLPAAVPEKIVVSG